MTILDFLIGPERDAPKVTISSSGQMSVDFAEVMRTSQFQRDLEALKEIAATVKP